MQKKSNSEGSVYYNKSRNRFTAQFYELDSKTGQNKRKTKDFKTEEEAKKYLENIMYQKQNLLYIEHNGIPLLELMKSNLNLRYETNLISDIQYVRIKETLNTIKKADISDKRIEEITSEEIQDFLNSKKYLSNSSIDKIFEQFKQAFNYASNRGYITRNPMINVIKPKSLKKNKKVRALTVEEQQKFTNWLINRNPIDFPYKNAFLIQMYSGLRIGETLALTYNDIDLKNQRIHINKTLTKNKENKTIMGNSTKTYAGIREVPVPNSLYPHLVEQMRISREFKNNPEKLLFKSNKNNYIETQDVNRALKLVLKYNWGINDITTHNLRHTYGTRCIEAGMQPVVLQRLLGHTDISTTLNTYTDVLNEFKKEEIEKLNDYYLQKDLLPEKNNSDEMQR